MKFNKVVALCIAFLLSFGYFGEAVYGYAVYSSSSYESEEGNTSEVSETYEEFLESSSSEVSSEEASSEEVSSEEASSEEASSEISSEEVSSEFAVYTPNFTTEDSIAYRFVDPVFLQVIQSIVGDSVYQSELDEITFLDLRGLGIYNLEGIQYLSNLQSLTVSENFLDSLDVSQNHRLTYLDVRENNIQTSVVGWEEIGLTLDVDFLFYPQRGTQEMRSQEQAGENLFWFINEQTLEITGHGDMWDFDYAPWSSYADVITSVFINHGVTSIGDRAFANLTKLQTVHMPETIVRVGREVYDNTPELRNIRIFNSSQGRVMIMPLASDPGLDLLLQGFNLLGNQDFTRSNLNLLISDTARLNELGNTLRNFTGGGDATARFHAESSMGSLMQSWGGDLSLGISSSQQTGGSFKGVRANLGISSTFNSQTSFAQAVSSSEESFFAALSIERSLGRNHIIGAGATGSGLNTLRWHNYEIWNSLNPMVRNELLYGDPTSLFGSHGTHIVTSYNMGGRAESVTGILRTASSNEMSISQAFQMQSEISVGAGVGNIASSQMATNFNAAISATYNRFSTSSAHETTRHSHIRGGNRGIGSALTGNEDFSVFNTWLDSVNAGNPIDTTEILINDHLVLVGIWELLPPEYSARALELEQAFLQRAMGIHAEFFNQFVRSTAVIQADMPIPSINENTVIISTPAELNAVRNNLGGNFILANDIDMSGFPTWTPIGTATNPFRGTFHGSGNRITNIHVAPSSDSPGLFGYNAGTIEYLAVEYSSRFGGVAGVNTGTVSNSHVSFIPKTINQTITLTTSTTSVSINNVDTVLLDFRGINSASMRGMTVTVPANVETVIFRDSNRNTTFHDMRIVVQGANTNVVFENFRMVQGISNVGTNATLPGIQFTGNNPSITSIGTQTNSVHGSPAILNSSAAGNLFIGGTNNFDALNTASSGGRAGIELAGTGANGALRVGLVGATLRATGGTGAQGASIANPANRTSNGNGNAGLTGNTGAVGGFGISASRIDLYNNSNLTAEGGTGGRGGTGQRGQNGEGRTNNGGRGGHGGTGGAGGSPIRVNTVLNFSPHSNVNFVAGIGGQGGIGGRGGDGASVFTGNGSGGNGGNGGIGGNHGGLWPFATTAGRSAGGSGGAGGNRGSSGAITASNGNTGVSGAASVAFTATNPTQGATLSNAQRSATRQAANSNYSNPSFWAGNTNLRVVRTSDPNFNRYPTSLFDPTGFRFYLGNVHIPTSRLDFRFDFSADGTRLVTVIHRMGNQQAVAYIPVRVVQPTRVGTTLTPPRTTTFFQGEELDFGGLAINVNYSDGSSRLVTQGLVLGNTPTTVGTHTVQVSHPNEGNVGSFTYTIANDLITNIEIINMPSQQNFLEGTVFNPTGMLIRVTYASAGYEYAGPARFNFSHTNLDRAGTIAVSATIDSFNGAGRPVVISTSFNINVVADPVNSISLFSLPNQEYFVGEMFDREGLGAELVRASGRRETIQNFTLSPDRPLVASDTSITLTFWDADFNFHNANIPITVTPVVATGIEIYQMPEKTSFFEFDHLDTYGLVVYRIYNNGNRVRVPDLDLVFSHIVLSVGDEVTVRHGIFTEELQLNIVPIEIVEVEIEQMPTTTEFQPDQIFSPQGIVVRATTNTGEVRYLENAQIQPSDIVFLTEVEVDGQMTLEFLPNRPLTAEDRHVFIKFDNVFLQVDIYVEDIFIIRGDEPIVTAGTVTGRRGTEVSLDINISNNPGVVVMALAIHYDNEQLELIGFTANGILQVFSPPFDLEANPIRFLLENGELSNNQQNGNLITLHFRVGADLDEGLAVVHAEILEAFNMALQSVEFISTPGGVRITTVLFGDLNGDGVVNSQDLLLLRQYLAGYPVEIDRRAADVNGDGVINSLDLLILRQYLAGFDVILGPPQISRALVQPMFFEIQDDARFTNMENFNHFEPIALERLLERLEQ